MSSVGTSFRLAPMSRLILILTVGLWALPIALLASAVFQPARAAPALLLVAIYAWAWLRFRPTRFVVHPATLEVVWPLKRRVLQRSDITAIHVFDGPQLRSMTGWCMRVGAGGLWSAFGWLWTRRRGIVQMYISRTDRFVWIERATVADFTGTTRGIHARACAVGLLTPVRAKVLLDAPHQGWNLRGKGRRTTPLDRASRSQGLKVT